ncbi:MAG: ATP-binding protein [Coprococcus sp.]|nr:ATP-binding protein [Coprococcus sp.]
MPLTNSQYNALMRIYEEKQAKSRYRLNQHYQNACRKIPELSSIDDAISVSSVEQARKLLDGDQDALLALKEQIRRLSQKRAFLLESHGFPADYLEPSYECPDCQDTGYINNKKCRCFQKSIIDLFYTQSHLRGTLELENFEHFSFDYYSRNYIDKLSGQSARALAERAYQEASAFIHDFDTSHGNLLLFGTTGIGKTFLSNCIAREVMLSVHSVLYLTATEFFDALLSKTLEHSEESLFLYEQIQGCDLLIIDDLGTERNTDFIVSQLFVCLNDRIMNKKSTIISTNLTLEKIKSNYTERTFSRISNHYKILRLAGDDIRIQKKLMNREEN